VRQTTAEFGLPTESATVFARSFSGSKDAARRGSTHFIFLLSPQHVCSPLSRYYFLDGQCLLNVFVLCQWPLSGIVSCVFAVTFLSSPFPCIRLRRGSRFFVQVGLVVRTLVRLCVLSRKVVLVRLLLCQIWLCFSIRPPPPSRILSVAIFGLAIRLCLPIVSPCCSSLYKCSHHLLSTSFHVSGPVL
jgi:hypothetical protein